MDVEAFEIPETVRAIPGGVVGVRSLLYASSLQCVEACDRGVDVLEDDIVGDATRAAGGASRLSSRKVR